MVSNAEYNVMRIIIMLRRPVKDSSKLKDSRKWNGNSNGNDSNVEMRGENCSSQKDTYSSQNGYGGKGECHSFSFFISFYSLIN